MVTIGELQQWCERKRVDITLNYRSGNWRAVFLDSNGDKVCEGAALTMIVALSNAYQELVK